MISIDTFLMFKNDITAIYLECACRAWLGVVCSHKTVVPSGTGMSNHRMSSAHWTLRIVEHERVWPVYSWGAVVSRPALISWGSQVDTFTVIPTSAWSAFYSFLQHLHIAAHIHISYFNTFYFINNSYFNHKIYLYKSETSNKL